MDGYIFRFIVLGEKGCGKTWLVNHWLGNNSVPQQTTQQAVVVQKYEKVLDEFLSGKEIKLQITDTSGDVIYRQIIRRYLPRNTCVILVYNIEYRQSFEKLTYWFQLAKEELTSNQTHFVVVGVCNETQQDCLRAVYSKDVHDWIRTMPGGRNAYIRSFEVFLDTVHDVAIQFDTLISEIYMDIRQHAYRSLKKTGISIIQNDFISKPLLVLAPSPPSSRHARKFSCCEKNESEPCIKFSFCSLL